MKYSINNPICPKCTAWREEIYVDKVLWMKCMGCGFMEKAIDTIKK